MRARASSSLIPALDHLILLVNDPPKASSQRTSALERSILVFSELGFQVSRGGLHADGLTSNALIVFPDGVYIELIQFEPTPAPESGENQQDFEARRRKHWWYHCAPGWIDWCLQDGISDGLIESINDNAKRLRESALQELQSNEGEEGGAKVVAPRLLYSAPQEGGRTTTRGDEIKWKVSFPTPPSGKQAASPLPIGNERSAVPFWCADLTPRDLRVPPTYAHHHNGSQGIAEITLLYAKDTVTSYLDVSLALNQPVQPDTLPITTDFQLVPNQIPHRLLSTLSSAHKPDAIAAEGITTSSHHDASAISAGGGKLIRAIIKVAEDPEDEKWVQEHGEGLYEVSVYVAADKLPASAPPDGIERTTFEAGFGRIRLSPILH
ncbi:Glyoxalase-like domain protein [Kalmanozyma brasiliensis GHG001]|uniref:Glyoxalase-like domain-containing protein n=1 Tax=Kalmanozyma brasiliensis (strain GHG001) TaxID=1365824 RepID=V5EUT7_KALBG|nr:Glyoxalase-like domain protein [Kalmanozyma brasiliensis GHG001]EST09150.1 Glyoxalase-like domain protein [Kalmanozyma brasiliensis GHG001]